MKKPIVIVIGAQLAGGKFCRYRLCWDVEESVRKIRQSGLVSGILLVVLGEVPAEVPGEDVRGVHTVHRPRVFPGLVELEEFHDAREGGVIQRLTPHLTSETTKHLERVFGYQAGVPPVEVTTLNVPSYSSKERMFRDILGDVQYLPTADFALVYSPNGGLMIPTVGELIHDIENPSTEHRVTLGGSMRKAA